MVNSRDSRMWNAVGNCYEKMSKNNEARLCLEKSEGLTDQEGISLFQLGKMYDILNLKKKAVSCFEENLAKKDKMKLIDKEMGEELLYLAYYYKEIGDFEMSLSFAKRMLDFTGIERQEA